MSKLVFLLSESLRITLLKVPFSFFFKVISLITLSAQFPDQALRAEFTIGARVGTGLAVFQALSAITDLHFLTGYVDFTVRMIFTPHAKPL